MTEHQIKEACKYVVDHGDRPLTKVEKEIIKQAIDQANNLGELFGIAMTVANIQRGGK